MITSLETINFEYAIFITHSSKMKRKTSFIPEVRENVETYNTRPMITKGFAWK